MLSILLYIGEIVSANIMKVYKNDNDSLKGTLSLILVITFTSA